MANLCNGKPDEPTFKPTISRLVLRGKGWIPTIAGKLINTQPVSYTHLTLPTKA